MKEATKMLQPPTSQTIFYHSIESLGVLPFNIRVYDRPRELGFDMWQVSWWREIEGQLGVEGPTVHTDWNPKRIEYPDTIYTFDEVTIPGWDYWWGYVRAVLPLPGSPHDMSSIIWARDGQGDVELYLIEDIDDPERELAEWDAKKGLFCED
jgi:hypothetical protein